MMKSIPKYIYHYTSFESIKNIIDSGQFWLFNIKDQCVNDKYELFDGGNIAYKVLKELFLENINKNNINSNLNYLPYIIGTVCNIFSDLKECHKLLEKWETGENAKKLNDFINIIDNTVNFFIASSATSHDNDYLWKEYGENNEGFILCFDTDILIQNNSNFNFHKVIYNEEGHYKGLEMLIRKKYSESGINPLSILSPVTQAAILFKRNQYSKEDEIRFVAVKHPMENVNVNISQLNDGRTYISLPVPKNIFYKSIKRIYFGSEANKNDIDEIKIYIRLRRVKCEQIQL